MAFSAGKNVTFSLNGTAIGTFLSNVSLTRNGDTLDVTTFGDSDRDFIQGLRSATITISGYFDPTASTGPDAVLATSFADTDGVAFQLVFGTGTTVQYSGSCLVASYETSAAVDGIIAFSASLTATGAVSRS
jgi:predicted secreted protein